MTAISSVGLHQVGVPQLPNETKIKKRNQPTQETQESPTFKAKTQNDQFVKSYEVEASSGKKWGVGIASAFLPGLGQAINGDWGKGVGFFLGTGVLGFLSKLAAASGKIGLGLAGGLATLGLGIVSIVDAVKSAKSTVQVVDKEGLKANGVQNT